jgi:hypothetical protein
LQVEMDFPYPPIHSTKYKYEVCVDLSPLWEFGYILTIFVGLCGRIRLPS